MAFPSIGHSAVTIKAQLVKGAFNGFDPNDAVWRKGTEYNVALDTTITATGVPQPIPSSKFKYLKVKAIHNGTDLFFRLRVTCVKRQGAGLLKTLVEANGLLVLPEDSRGARPGDRVLVQLYDLGSLESADPALLTGSRSRAGAPEAGGLEPV